jgi:hypothetical protein
MGSLNNIDSAEICDLSSRVDWTGTCFCGALLFSVSHSKMADFRSPKKWIKVIVSIAL